MNVSALVAAPAGVASVILPLFAPLGTTAVTWVSLTNAKVAAVPLNVTEMTPVKRDPLIVTVLPTSPLFGLMPAILGPLTVNVPGLVAVPAGVTSVILPVVAPLGTTAVTLVALTNVKGAEVPLNATELTPVKFVPLIVTVVPTPPPFGLKLLIVGPEPVTLKLVRLVARPEGVVSVICPVVAPFGTVAVTFPLFTNVKLAEVPLNFTEFTPVKLVPWMVTLEPTCPLDGLKLEIVGALPGSVTMKLPPLWVVPCGVPTTIGPVVAPLGTLTVIFCPVAFTLNPGAFVPLNVTEVVPTKFVPWMATLVPTGPLPGSKLEMVGEPPAMAETVVRETTKTTSAAVDPI